MKDFLDIQNLEYIVIGMLVFFISNIDDIGKNEKSTKQQIQYSLYTIIAIVIGIAICYLTEAHRAMFWIVTILCGMLGGMVLTKIDTRKEEIGDTAVDKIKNTISSSDIAKMINSKNVESTKTLIVQEHATKQGVIDDSNTFVDYEQSPYNPFEDEANSTEQNS